MISCPDRVSPRTFAMTGKMAGAGPLLPAVPRWRAAALTLASLSALANVLLLSGSLFMLLVYDTVLPARSLPSLAGLVLLLAVACAFQGALDHARQAILADIAVMIDRAFSARVFVLAVAPAEAAGSLAITPARDLETLRRFLAGPAPAAMLDLPFVALFLAVLFACHWLLGLAALAGAALLAGLAVVVDRIGSAVLRDEATVVAQRGDRLAECFREGAALRAMGMVQSMAARWEALRPGRASPSLSVLARLQAFSRTFRLLLQSLVMALGAALVIAGEASGGTIVAASVLAARALGPLDAVIAHWRGIALARQAWVGLAAHLASEPAQAPHTPLPRPTRSLAVEGLCLAAPGTTRLLLEGIGFALEAGAGLALVGASGAGKSTLLMALAGAFAVSRGAVRADGADVSLNPPGCARDWVGLVPQEPALLRGTVAENIGRFAPGASADAIIAAAREAGAHDLVVRLPQGYDTPIGPGGHALSGGQARLVALARALFGSPFLLLLDEPDTGLDAAGTQALDRAIAAARRRGAIVIVASHRQGMVAGLDQVLWLEAGRVRAFGSAGDVLARATSGPARRQPRGPAIGMTLRTAGGRGA